MANVKLIEDYIKYSLNDIRKNMEELRQTKVYATKYSEDKKIDPERRKALRLIVEVCKSLLAFFSFCEKSYSLEDDVNKFQFIRLTESKKNGAIKKLNKLIKFIEEKNIKDVDLGFWEKYKESLENIKFD